jgi:thiosulfate dehydrogenase
MIDVSQYIDYDSNKPIAADVRNGMKLFEATCTGCHGNDGKKINFGNEVRPEYLGNLAAGNPWEVLHKIRFGQPGESMPAGIAIGWSVQDAVDVLSHTQTLPAE